MMKTARWLGTPIVGALLVTSVAFGLPAEAGETPSLIRVEGAEIVGSAPPQECDAAPGSEGLDLLASTSGAPGSSGTFYVCLGNDFFCGGGCPNGTHCATEACGSFLRPACTFQTACVGGCQVSPGCYSIASSCGF